MSSFSGHRTVRAGLPLLLALSVTMGGCGDDDSDDGAEADVAACRTIRLTDASLEGPRTQAGQGTFTPGQSAAYQVAIGTVTEAASDDDVSPELLAAASSLIGAWSRTSGIIDSNVNASSYDPTNVRKFLSAEMGALKSLVDICPG